MLVRFVLLVCLGKFKLQKQWPEEAHIFGIIILHWLPIEQRIKYKTSCLCYQIISDTAPQYLAEPVRIYVPSRSLRSSSSVYS